MKNIKKITSIIAGLSLFGATLSGAAAASLQDYPNLFIRDNTFNGFFVTGGNAQSSDISAAVNIAESLPVTRVVNDTAGRQNDTTQNFTIGDQDVWEIGTNTNEFEISNNDASLVTGESIPQITPFIDGDDLEVLRDSAWETGADDFEYEQSIIFTRETDFNTSRLVKFAENDEDETDLFFFIRDGQEIARYSLRFTTVAEADLEDDVLEDFEDTTLEMFGKEFSVVEATRPAGTNSIQLTLLGGADEGRLEVGETRTFSVGGQDFEVELSFVDNNEAQFIINGQLTRLLEEGETQRLRDGTQIGVRDILFQDFAGGIQAVTFFIGAQKWELRDDDVTDNSGTYRVTSEADEIEGTTTIIRGSSTANTFSISTIDVVMTAEDDYFVSRGGSLRQAIEQTGEEDRVLFPGSWDIVFNGLTEAQTHQLSLTAPQEERYELSLFDGNGNEVKLPIAFAEGENNLTMGARSETETRNRQQRLILTETDEINVNDFFVVTDGSPEDGSAESFLLQYQRADDIGQSGARIRFRDQGSGQTIEESISLTGDSIATIRIGGFFFEVANATAMTEDDFAIRVDLNGNGNQNDTGFVPFIDSFGSQWELLQVNGTGTAADPDESVWRMSVPNENDFDTTRPSDITLRITAVADGVRAELEGMTLISPEGETDIEEGYNSMGARIRFTEESGEADELRIDYPNRQILPQVFFVAGNISTVTDGAQVPTNLRDQFRENGQVENIEAQNLIVVGGPCVSSVAAELLNGPDIVGDIERCTENFTPGQARIRLFEHASGNVAMLVAGYSAADTRMAAEVLARRADELTGTEVIISGTNADTAVITVVEESDTETGQGNTTG